MTVLFVLWWAVGGGRWAVGLVFVKLDGHSSRALWAWRAGCLIWSVLLLFAHRTRRYYFAALFTRTFNVCLFGRNIN